jgi:hypothetical protein
MIIGIKKIKEASMMADDEAWKDLKAILSDRIARASAGAVSTRTCDQIVAEELSKRALEPGELEQLSAKLPYQSEGSGDFVRRMRDEDRY